MDLIRNILAHFKKSKHSQNEATFNEITIKSITKAKVVPESSNYNEKNDPNAKTVANDISNSMTNSENTKGTDTTSNLINKLDIESNIWTATPTANNDIDSPKNNNKNNKQENLPKEIDISLNETQVNINNDPNTSNLDENTINCIKEFDSILGCVQNTQEIVSLDEFNDLFPELNYDDENSLNIDPEESIPGHFIIKHDYIKNDAVQTGRKPAEGDNSNSKPATIELEYNINVERYVESDSTEIYKNKEVTSKKIDNKTKDDRYIQSRTNDLDHDIKDDSRIISAAMKDDNNIRSPSIANNRIDDINLESCAMLVENNIKSINVNAHTNNTKVNIHYDIVTTEIQVTENVLESNDELNRNIERITIEVDNNSKIDNKTELITRQDNNNNIQEIDVDLNTKRSDSKEITLTNLDHNTETNKIIINNVLENSEIISISSDEIIDLDDISTKSEENIDSDCGYHSSDFEFISEDEANLDGFIINFKLDKNIEESLKTVKESEINFEPNNLEKTPKIVNENQPGPSGLNTNYESYRNKYPRPILIDRTYRDRHAVPEGEGYLDLFRGMYDPAVSSILMENKSIKNNRSMLVEFEGIGFERQLVGRRRDSSEDEHQDEADETAKKIQHMYPGENRKRRRRF